MKIGILGAGALGCVMGGVLTEAGHEVWLINRNAEQVAAMNCRGLILRTDGVDRTVRVHAATTAQDRATQELLKQVIERLDRIEKRLDAMEKKEPEKKK